MAKGGGAGCGCASGEGPCACPRTSTALCRRVAGACTLLLISSVFLKVSLPGSLAAQARNLACAASKCSIAAALDGSRNPCGAQRGKGEMVRREGRWGLLSMSGNRPGSSLGGLSKELVAPDRAPRTAARRQPRATRARRTLRAPAQCVRCRCTSVPRCAPGRWPAPGPALRSRRGFAAPPAPLSGGAQAPAARCPSG